MTRRELMEKYKDTLAAIEVANPKSNGETYDMDVCLDMLKADLKAIRIGQEMPYPFEGVADFDWETFESDYNALA